MPARVSFDRSLAGLQQDILRMASLVENAIYESVEALAKMDVTAASQVIMGDERVDELYLEIEDQCVKLIATQQPIARDLRIAITGIKISLSLERMADHCVDIGRATMCLSGMEKGLMGLEDIREMSRLARQMVKDGLDAYVHSDVEKARDMCACDDEVDFLFNKIFRETMEAMAGDPDKVMQGSYLLYVSRYLERIADHATNIGEAVIYLVTGERKELN